MSSVHGVVILADQRYEAPLIQAIQRHGDTLAIVRRCADLAEVIAAARAGVADLAVIDGSDPDLTAESIDALRSCFEQVGESIAAVIFEGAPANMGTVPPHPGWNREIRRLCTAHGALMILDEVLTGFRVDPAGWWGLEAVAGWVDGAPAGGYGAGFVDASSVERADWVPDLVTFGKVVGGGMPLAAVAGRADVMDLLAPLGPVYQAGTLSGNPLATVAGLRTLELADQSVYDRVNASAQEISTIVSDARSAAGVAHRLQRPGAEQSTGVAARHAGCAHNRVLVNIAELNPQMGEGFFLGAFHRLSFGCVRFFPAG